ncbi:MAG: glycoside hydrolase, family 31 [Candidatus Solibacter sp.]|nr:glycoside hydrolase, family 31 [Candidatus Solibacter sp.]
MPPQALAAIATLLSFAPHGNRVELRLDHGSAELVWLTPSTFHFRRVLDGALRPAEEATREPVVVQTEDGGREVRIRSRLLEVTIVKQGVLVRVRRINGATLMTDLTAPRSEAGGVVWERQMTAESDYFGLGPRTDPTLSARGKSLAADVPLLLSTAGYGEFHPGGGTYHFDFTQPDRYRIQGPEIDYYFYYGPTPKEIFEEHNGQPSHAEPWTVNSDRFGSWASLKASLLRIVEGAMSAANAPMLNLAPYNNAPPELLARARQLGSLVARVSPGTVGLSGFRKQLDTFYGSYIAELQDRGFPIWHPLPFQVPDDPEGARHPDEFLLGDEMLIAPICEPGDKRSVYLPRGIWTNLETNETTQGPKTITVETKSLPVFARNGALIPLTSTNGMALHYFPKLGGEFFLLEGDIADYSQVHAAPALDITRLEIESKKDRDYQWVVHHADKPASVGFDTKQYREVSRLETLADDCWFYDAAQKNLHVRVKVKAGEDCIINLNY